MRYLNKYERRDGSYRYFLLAATLEYVGDKISSIAKYIDEDVDMAKFILNVIKKYNKYFFAHDLRKLYSMLRRSRNSISHKTFVDGLSYSLVEALYNNIGYLIEGSLYRPPR